MIALHARRSHDSARRFKLAYPARPLAVALTGTDVYRDIATDASARATLRLADRLVVLQERALDRLRAGLRRKTHVIYQSARRTARTQALTSCFEVLVSGHLRQEKDPFRVAASLQYIPEESAIRVVHLGKALSDETAREAREWMAREPRYRWLGEVPHAEARRRLARSRVMVISSRMEGGANVVSEALAAGVPVLASQISGNVGMLGSDYAGYFPVENERALARLLRRAESDPSFYLKLKKQCVARRILVQPQREARCLKRLLDDLNRTIRAPRPRSRRRYWSGRARDSRRPQPGSG